MENLQCNFSAKNIIAIDFVSAVRLTKSSTNDFVKLTKQLDPVAQKMFQRNARFIGHAEIILDFKESFFIH